MRYASFLALFGTVGAASAQTIVYDNTANYSGNMQALLSDLIVESAELGDELNLAGTDRTATELTLVFLYRGTNQAVWDARVRLYAVDGENSTPGTRLYSSAILPGMVANPGLNEYTFSIPHITVPDRVVWTIEGFNGVGIENELGPAYFHPPTVGTSEDWFWRSERGSEWTPYGWGGSPYANFGSRLTAVPEPASALALAAALPVMLRPRRRQRR